MIQRWDIYQRLPKGKFEIRLGLIIAPDEISARVAAWQRWPAFIGSEGTQACTYRRTRMSATRNPLLIPRERIQLAPGYAPGPTFPPEDAPASKFDTYDVRTKDTGIWLGPIVFLKQTNTARGPASGPHVDNLQMAVAEARTRWPGEIGNMNIVRREWG